MADLDDDDVFCDFCGRRDGTRKFCTLCGMDYCDRCAMTHDAQHEFIREAIANGNG